MAENTAISWTRHTWNPVIGCLKVSPACDGCYAEAMMDKRYGRVHWGAPGKGTGTRIRTSASTWNDPFRWQKQAECDGDRPFVFCASLADIFDNQWDPQWRADAFNVMRKTPRLVYLLLTKRPQNIVKLAEAAGGLPDNAALGTTMEDQPRADINLPHLLIAAAKLRPLFTFGSLEPLLGHVDVRWALSPRKLDVVVGIQARGHFSPGLETIRRLDWVITGGETDQIGHSARPTHYDNFISLRDQCAAAGIPFHHKQNGEWVPAGHESIIDATENLPVDHSLGRLMVKVGKKRAGRLLDGVTHDAFPEVRR